MAQIFNVHGKTAPQFFEELFSCRVWLRAVSRFRFVAFDGLTAGIAEDVSIVSALQRGWVRGL